MRLFFALPLPAEAKERMRPAIGEARKAAGDGVGFTKVEQLHFTLAFLGEQRDDEGALAAASEALAQTAAFELAIAGAGGFPNNMRPRVLWLGVTAGAAEMMALASALRQSLRERKVTFDEKPFRPHLTFGRVRPRGERNAKAALASIGPGELVRCLVTQACLMQSTLGGSAGAKHTLVRAFPFRQ
jgi:RNA 2',3'-cyclic 3'-phosphodiesterase